MNKIISDISDYIFISDEPDLLTFTSILRPLVTFRHVVADYVSFATTFFERTERCVDIIR